MRSGISDAQPCLQPTPLWPPATTPSRSSWWKPHLARCWGPLGPNRRAFLELGHYDSGSGATFNMTALALRTADHVNAVSQVHTGVTRDMWAPIWPAVATRGGSPPVRTVTNGVHLTSWVAGEMDRLFDQYLGDDWRARQDEPGLWDRIHEIPGDQLWAARQVLRTSLFDFIRERARERLDRGASGYRARRWQVARC